MTGRLEIDGISRRYGDVVALQEMTFEVRTGELFGFVGSNGAGKTTTMRMMPIRLPLGAVSLWQAPLAVALVLLLIPGLISVAGRICRNAVLRTAARVRLRDALR